MLMSEVLSSLIQDMREDYGMILPVPERLQRMFNDVQLQLAVELECVPFIWQTVVQPYATVSGTINNGSSATNIIVLDDTTDDSDIDKTADYAGYILRDDTTLDQATVLASANPSGDLVVLTLDHAIDINIDADDAFTLAREARYVDCPWFVIRPHLDEGVIWDDTPLVPVSFSRQNSYQHNLSIGDPNSYAIEAIGSGLCRLHIYPRPSQAGTLRVVGVRRPAECFFGVATSNGATAGTSVISSEIPLKRNDYYVGSELLAHSVAPGEVCLVTQYARGTHTLTLNPAFSATMVIGAKIELISPLPDEFREAIDHYLRWKVLSRKGELFRLADRERALYEDAKDRLITITQRKITANVRLNSYPNTRQSRYRVMP